VPVSNVPKMTIEDRIVAALNQTIGKDVENLGKSSILVKNYRKDLENVKAKVNIGTCFHHQTTIINFSPHLRYRWMMTPLAHCLKPR
jgi:hypothetical protein